MTRLERGWIEVGAEDRVYWEAAGNDTAGTVVLTHGFGGSHASWFHQVPFLADAGYRVITWDQRGFGRSTDLAGDASTEAYACDLAALLAAHCDSAAHLVGQSLGGWTIAHFATSHPDRVRSIVFADTIAGLWTPAAETAWAAHVDRRRAGLQPDEVGIHPAVGPAADVVTTFLYQQLASFADPPMHIAHALRTTQTDPSALRAPTLFVVGSDDDLFPPVAIRAAADLVAGATVVEIAGAGHSPYFEKPADWNDVVLAFWRGQEPLAGVGG
jgi:3-oxoadipate enol-lactonase